MAHLLSHLLFALAVAAAPSPSNPFEGTNTTVEEDGTLSIQYSGPDHTITITDVTQENSWEVEIVGGQASWEVPEIAEEFLVLSDSQGDGFTVRLVPHD